MGTTFGGIRENDPNIVPTLSAKTLQLQSIATTMVTRAKGKKPLSRPSTSIEKVKKKAKSAKATSQNMLVMADVHLSGAVLVKCIAQATAACCPIWTSGITLAELRKKKLSLVIFVLTTLRLGGAIFLKSHSAYCALGLMTGHKTRRPYC